ncbi:MAG TPA: DUF2167 domain-containing protein [Methylocella sp.]
MNWKDATNVRLVASNAVITNLPGFKVVTGQEARRVRELIDPIKNDTIEAEAFNPDTDSEIEFMWFPAGYVASDDWSNVDANDMLAQIQKNDIAANVERKNHGVPSLTATGWRQTPTLNTTSHTVSWIIDGESSDGSHVINAVALKLGRYGFEKIIWISDAKTATAPNDLLLAEKGFEFERGAGYGDYLASSDRTAAYGNSWPRCGSAGC